MDMSSMVLGFSTGDQIGANLLQCFDLIHGGKEPKTRGEGKVWHQNTMCKIAIIMNVS